MNIESIVWESSQPLSEAYLRSFAKVAELYEYNPFEPASWQERAGWLDQSAHLRVDREKLAQAIVQFNERAGSDGIAIESAKRLADSQSLVVVGGQQAGLLTGPLLVIYKAITVLKAAKEAEARLERPVVPVFWIAGEDHDFDEVNHIVQLSAELQLEKLKLEHPTGRRSSVSKLPIGGEQWSELLRQLDGSLMPTEFKAPLMDKLGELAGRSDTLVDFFAGMMAWLFRGTGLVLMDSDDPQLRKLERPLFSALLRRHQDIQAAVRLGVERVSGLGFKPQLEFQEGNANLFITDSEERVLLYSKDEGFSDRRQSRSYTVEQLEDWIETKPELLSNNVMTRPLMQEFLFPVLGAVLGPGEIAYWGVTRESFRTMEMRMPILIPRLEFTLLEGTVLKHMGKYELTVDDVIRRFEEKKQAWLAKQDTLHLDVKFAEARDRFKADYEPLVELIAGINPGLKKLGETNMAKIIEQIAFLENKASDAYRTQFDAALRQLSRIQLSVVPDGRPQERVYNVAAYLNKFGEGWLRELLDAPLEVDGKHRLCYI